MTDLTRRDAATILRALDTIPAECRYHGEKFEVDYGMHGVGSCCDVGRPTMYRKYAVEVLLQAVPTDE